MAYDLEDTIAGLGTAPGGAERGMVRVSGPQLIACLSSCFVPASAEESLGAIERASVISGTLHVAIADLKLPCDLFLWPTARSYTRQPTAEVHMLGSPPLLEAALQEICSQGARLAEPGEFTLRAFLAGRLDLTQAEAVLGVIDARGPQDLQDALAQLAGGLSQPLAQLREQLLQLLAELEAGLDFVEDDIVFVSPEHIRLQLAEARHVVSATRQKISGRKGAHHLPRVVLVGRANAGKSSLFNALMELSSRKTSRAEAIVSDQSGTTRDYLTAIVKLDGTDCEIVDTAGENPFVGAESISGAAQEMTAAERRRADLLLRCVDSTALDPSADAGSAAELLVLTKADKIDGTPPTADGGLLCSVVTRVGLDELQREIRRRLRQPASTAHSVVASTAARCGESLRLADESLDRATRLVDHSGGEELIAAELRRALQELGDVVGAVYTDDILDRIFSQFCIGK